MWTKYVRIVPSSAAAGLSLSGEIAQAFERVRERAFTIYDSRSADDAGSEFDDWLRAERELFEVPDASVESDGEVCRLLVHAQAQASRPLTIFVEPGMVTVMGHRSTDRTLCLYRRVSLSEMVDPDRVRLVLRRGTGIQVVMTHQRVPTPEPADVPTLAPAVVDHEVFAA